MEKIIYRETDEYSVLEQLQKVYPVVYVIDHDNVCGIEYYVCEPSDDTVHAYRIRRRQLFHEEQAELVFSGTVTEWIWFEEPDDLEY